MPFVWYLLQATALHRNVAGGDGVTENQFVQLMRKMDAFSIQKDLAVAIPVRS